MIKIKVEEAPIENVTSSFTTDQQKLAFIQQVPQQQQYYIHHMNTTREKPSGTPKNNCFLFKTKHHE